MDYYIVTPGTLWHRTKQAITTVLFAGLTYAGIMAVPRAVGEAKLTAASSRIEDALKKSEYQTALAELDAIKTLPLLLPSRRDTLALQTHESIDSTISAAIDKMVEQDDYSGAHAALETGKPLLTPQKYQARSKSVENIHPDNVLARARASKEPAERYSLLTVAAREYADIGTPKPALVDESIVVGVDVLRASYIKNPDIPTGSPRADFVKEILTRASKNGRPIKLPSELKEFLSSRHIYASLNPLLRTPGTVKDTSVHDSLEGLTALGVDPGVHLKYHLEWLEKNALDASWSSATLRGQWNLAYTNAESFAPSVKPAALDTLLNMGLARQDEEFLLLALQNARTLQGTESRQFNERIADTYLTLVEQCVSTGNPTREKLSHAYRMLGMPQTFYNETGYGQSNPKVKKATALRDKLVELLKKTD